ncbi:MAG: thioredoxin family protein [Bacteroidia bacterium]|nr:thioredoxin family protein [Bacteroidia bacterium]MCX7763313.1 thioredoxin family protein [Bacteroidia bacterium]MDW8057092.1 thioredoxin family protein [Bacteroidia bacterium]
MRIWLVAWAAWLFAQGGGVRFFQGSWQALLSEAQKQKRPIFVDFYTVWCGPCKMLERYTFSNPEVGDYVEKNYLAYRVDAEKGDGVRLADQYRIRAYPTIVFLDPQGNEIGRHIGYADAPTFLNILRRYSEQYAKSRPASQPSWESFREQYKVFFSDLTRQTWDTSFEAKLARIDTEPVEGTAGGSVAEEVLRALSAWRRGQKEAALHTLHHKLYQQQKLTPQQTLWLAAYALLNWEAPPPETIQWVTFSTKKDPTGVGYLTQAALYYRLGRISEAQKSLKEAQRDLPHDIPAVNILSTLLSQK